MRAWLRVGVVAAFAALLLGASEPTQSGVVNALPPTDRLPLWSPDGTSIAFATNRDAAARGREVALLELSFGQALHVVTRTGEERRLALLDRFDAYSISPDWRSLAVVGYVEREYALFTMNLDGSDRRRLADAYPLEPPSWSPDGTRLAFAGPDRIVRTIQSDGTRVRTIGEGAAPRWSPDGSRIAFVSLSPPGVGVADADGARHEVLATGHASGLSWSPDGSRIAFHAGLGKLSVVDVRSGGRHEIHANAVTNRAPAWSPRGDRLAFVASQAGKLWIAVVAAAGGKPSAITAAQGRAASDPSWSPDGTEIAYSDIGACGRPGIHVVNLATRKSARLTNDCRIVGTPRGDRIVGTALVDVIDAGAGNDRVAAGEGDDVVLAGTGRDVVADGPGRDLVLGGRGADNLHGDRLLGGPGRDRLFSSNGWRADINARDGERDWISCGSPRRDTVTADRFDRVARDCEFVTRR